jgi:hypothetical protein
MASHTVGTAGCPLRFVSGQNHDEGRKDCGEWGFEIVSVGERPIEKMKKLHRLFLSVEFVYWILPNFSE